MSPTVLTGLPPLCCNLRSQYIPPTPHTMSCLELVGCAIMAFSYSRKKCLLIRRGGENRDVKRTQQRPIVPNLRGTLPLVCLSQLGSSLPQTLRKEGFLRRWRAWISWLDIIFPKPHGPPVPSSQDFPVRLGLLS